MARKVALPDISRSQLVKWAKNRKIQLRISSSFKKYARFKKIDATDSFISFRIKDTKWFDKRSFRTIEFKSKRYPKRLWMKMTVGAQKGKWDPKTKRAVDGMTGQRILVPMQRVYESAMKIAKPAITKGELKKLLANPLLMTMFANPKKKKKKVVKRKTKKSKTKTNPARTALSRCPFKGKSISFPKFRAWLHRYGTAKEIKDFEKSVKAYVKFHGVFPKKLSRQLLKIGTEPKKITERAFLWEAGKVPAEMYITGKRSKKTPKGQTSQAYKHDWKRMPVKWVDKDGKLIMQPLKGKAKVKDWMHG